MSDSRANPWPLAVALVYGGFAAVMIGFVIWSVGHRVELVAPDYYARELAYQQEIDALSRSMPYDGQVQWHQQDGQLEIRVDPPLRDVLTNAVVRFYRPSDAALDHDVPLVPDGQGRFRLDTTALVGGFWRARIEWTQSGQDYAIETSLIH